VFCLTRVDRKSHENLSDAERKQPFPLEDVEIGAIQAAAVSGAPRKPCPCLQVGETVQIESGRLRGLEGILVVEIEAGVVRCERLVGRLA
jgi:transcription antitermination factor NusG